MKHSFPSTTLTSAKLTFPRALLKTVYQLITAPYKTSYHLLFSVRAKSCVWVSWISVLKGREYFVRRKQEKPAWFKLQLVLNPNAIEMVKNRACPLTSVINDSVALSLFRLISISLMTSQLKQEISSNFRSQTAENSLWRCHMFWDGYSRQLRIAIILGDNLWVFTEEY